MLDILNVLNRLSISYMIYGELLLSREMAVNEALPCDRNRFLVGISKLKKLGTPESGASMPFFPIHM